jgi:hypothetical protein
MTADRDGANPTLSTPDFPQPLTDCFRAFRLSFVLAQPAFVVTPLLRRLLGRTGVQPAPGLVAIANCALAFAALRLAKAEFLTDQRRKDVSQVVLVWLLVSPAVAGLGTRLVGFRNRSPLWDYVSYRLAEVAILGALAAGGVKDLKTRTSADASTSNSASRSRP